MQHLSFVVGDGVEVTVTMVHRLPHNRPTFSIFYSTWNHTRDIELLPNYENVD